MDLKKIFIFLTISVFITYTLLYLNQESLIFYPEKLKADYEFNFLGNYKELFIETKKDKVNALFFEDKASIGTILYFHGNAGSLRSWGEVASGLFNELKYNVLIIDYPGYGKSSGKITSAKQLFDLAKQSLEKAKVLTKNKPIILYGRSLGSGLASFLAQDKEIKAVVLETPYFSLKEIAQSIFFFIPSFIMKYKLESFKYLTHVDKPILFLHGSLDEVIPYEYGKKLFNSYARSSKKFILIETGRHNNLNQFPRYWIELRAFLKKVTSS